MATWALFSTRVILSLLLPIRQQEIIGPTAYFMRRFWWRWRHLNNYAHGCCNKMHGLIPSLVSCCRTSLSTGFFFYNSCSSLDVMDSKCSTWCLPCSMDATGSRCITQLLLEDPRFPFLSAHSPFFQAGQSSLWVSGFPWRDFPSYGQPHI